MCFKKEDEDYGDDKFEIFVNKLTNGMMTLVFALNVSVIFGAILALCSN